MSEIILDLDAIEEEPRYLKIGGKKFEIASMSLADSFRHSAFMETAERLKAADDAEGYATKMRAAMMLVMPEMTIADFEQIRGKKLTAFMEFVTQEANRARSGENPTEDR